MKSIRAKLTAGILVIFFVGIFLVTMVTNLISRTTILEEAIGRENEKAAYYAELIENWLDTQFVSLEVLGYSFLSVHDIDLFQKMAYPLLQQQDVINEIYIGFSDGNISYASGAPASIQSVEDAWFSSAMANKGTFMISTPYINEQSGQIYITISRFLGNIDGTDIVGAADVSANSLINIVHSLDVVDKGYAFLVDADGNIIFHPDQAFTPAEYNLQNIGGNAVYANAAASLKAGESKVKAVDYDSITRYFISQDIGTSSNWTLYVAVPESALHASIYSNFIYMAVTALVIMVIAAIIISESIKRLIVKPMKKLSDAAKQLAMGDLDIHIHTNSNDEMGILHNDFARVADTLTEVIADLQKMSDMHTDGEADYKIDESKFVGAFQQVVAGINKMTFMYIDNSSDILRVINQYRKGNFDAQIRQFPGKQAISNKIMDDLRKNLKAVNHEIIALAKTAAEGHLNVRANIEGFQGDWVEIFSNLNSLMDAVATPISEAVEVLYDLSTGDLQTNMDGEYEGDFESIKVSMNTTIEALSTYVSNISQVLDKMANDDLSQNIEMEYKGDFAVIKNSINAIIFKFNKILRELSSVAGQVNAGSKQISDSSSLLAKGAIEQTDTLENLTKSTEYVMEKTKKNAENAKTADSLSETTMQNALEGSKKMDYMLESIHSIKQSSNNIASIIKVIDDIAFQTNILALNAAVEAARAGEHGKGFAVVADEVRNLAVRSQEQAKGTQELIEDTIEKINAGAQTAQDTSEALATIVDLVTQVSRLIAQISADSSKEAESLAQIFSGINQMASVVQNNSSIAEEGAAAAEQLYAQSELLFSLLKVYTFEKSNTEKTIYHENPEYNFNLDIEMSDGINELY